MGRLFHQEKATVEAGTRIEDDLQGILGQHLLDLLVQGQRSRRSCLVRRKQYRGAREGRRRVQGGDVISVPQDGQHPGTCSNRLPVPPMHRWTTPHTQRRRDPVRRTFSRSLSVYPRSRRRPPKRVPFLCYFSSSDHAGKRKRKG